MRILANVMVSLICMPIAAVALIWILFVCFILFGILYGASIAILDTIGG